ncbi:hypothetical protein H0A36_27635 [Endozoicomonas sp. SM1973]|uniref:TIGR04222 domain-containing membrane protein n=1 Tax=Spartinivicinus marinus TaxID=2994442 RepID=A0A853IGY9_9GAMM|nr:hypothetical protein [Spartinivicinus marinus]MCX4030373.1 hypothetical protein [Spartinivicinus marinus]NYZ69788.1 hypothetical protein [Spartinivicinus marinus]
MSTELSGDIYFIVFFTLVIFLLPACLQGIQDLKDSTRKMKVPLLESPINPYKIAYLHGAINELTYVIAVSLVERGYAETFGNLIDDKIVIDYRQLSNGPDIKQLTPIERVVYDGLCGVQSEEGVLESLYQKVSGFCLAYEESLQQDRLLNTGVNKTLARKNILIGMTLIIGVFFVRLVLLGTSEGIFIHIILLVIGIYLVLFICSPERMSLLGKAYLRELRQTVSIRNTSYTLIAAIHGMSSLSNTSYADIEDLFRPINKNKVEDGCGGGCSGCGGCGGCG